MLNVDELSTVLSGIPHMTPEQGELITDFIRENRLAECLELGFAHGVGTAYIANAAQSLGGHVVAIDHETARARQPDISETLRMASIDSSAVEIYFEPSTYNWRLMKFLEAGRAGTFDFIYLDGAHAWEPDGMAFYLGEKLLRPGGWILFDDLNWTYASPRLERFAWVRAMPAEERHTAQVRKIWELLVKTHPSFDELLEKDDWAFARKSDSAGEARTQVVYRYHPLATTLLELKNVLRRARIRSRK